MMRIANIYTETEIAEVSLERLTNRKDRVIWRMLIPPMQGFDSLHQQGCDVTFGGDAGPLVLRSSIKVKVY